MEFYTGLPRWMRSRDPWNTEIMNSKKSNNAYLFMPTWESQAGSSCTSQSSPQMSEEPPPRQWIPPGYQAGTSDGSPYGCSEGCSGVSSDRSSAKAPPQMFHKPPPRQWIPPKPSQTQQRNVYMRLYQYSEHMFTYSMLGTPSKKYYSTVYATLT